MASVIVRVTLDWPASSSTAAGLGFLGLGAQPPGPSGGRLSPTAASSCSTMVGRGGAGAAICIVSLAFNLLGDGLRVRSIRRA